MTIDLSRHIRVRDAKGGGFSLTNEASPLPYEQSTDTIVFSPRFTDGRWNLELSDPEQANLTVRDADSSFHPGEFSLVRGIAPGGGDALRAATHSWRWLESTQDEKFTPPEGFTGVTLEMWVDFGPNGPFVENEGKGTTVRTFLSPRPQEENPIGPLAYLKAEVGVNDGFLEYGQISMTAGLVKSGVFNKFYSRADAIGLVVGAASIDAAGWNHYAAEFTPEGATMIYFNGQPMASASVLEDLPPSFWSDLDLFCPAWIFGQNATIGAGRPATDVHFVRYTPSLLYNGASFTPPLLP